MILVLKVVKCIKLKLLTFDKTISSIIGWTTVESVVESTESAGNSNLIFSLPILLDEENGVVVVVVDVSIVTFVVIGGVFTGAVIVSVLLCLE